MATKEERFLVQIYIYAKETRGVKGIFNPFEMGKQFTYSERQIKQLLQHLCQSNLIKKFNPEKFCLTGLGIEVAINLIDET